MSFFVSNVFSHFNSLASLLERGRMWREGMEKERLEARNLEKGRGKRDVEEEMLALRKQENGGGGKDCVKEEKLEARKQAKGRGEKVHRGENVGAEKSKE